MIARHNSNDSVDRNRLYSNESVDRNRLYSNESVDSCSNSYDTSYDNVCHTNNITSSNIPIINPKRRIRDYNSTDNDCYHYHPFSFDISNNKTYNNNWLPSNPPIVKKPRKSRIRDQPLHFIASSPVPDPLLITMNNRK
jgi:hypothetical protein